MQRSIFDEPAVAAAFAEAGVNPKHAVTLRRLALARLRENTGMESAARILPAHNCTPCRCICLETQRYALPRCRHHAVAFSPGETATLANLEEDEKAGRGAERIPADAWGALQGANFAVLSTRVAEATTSGTG